MFLALLAVAIVVTPTAVAAGDKKSFADPSNKAACTDSDDTPDFPWPKFTYHDCCIEFTNAFTFVYQKLLELTGTRN